jgi:hypothetical protein
MYDPKGYGVAHHSFVPRGVFQSPLSILSGTSDVFGLRRYGATIEYSVMLTPPIPLHNFADKGKKPLPNLPIGNDCYVGWNVFLDVKDRIVIKDKPTLPWG